MEDDADFATGFGGPGPEDMANGAAALASALVREACALAQAASALRTAVAVVPGDPAGGVMADVRRQRMALSAAGDAAMKAALLLEAAEVLAAGGEAKAIAGHFAVAAKRCGLPAAILVAPLRAAALALTTDDGAARIAAAQLAADLAGALAKA
jgi:hypothetical protein